jgi:hypothetical protein
MALLIPLDPAKFDPNTTQPSGMRYNRFQKLNVASSRCVNHLQKQTERLLSYLNQDKAFPEDKDEVSITIMLKELKAPLTIDYDKKEDTYGYNFLYKSWDDSFLIPVYEQLRKKKTPEFYLGINSNAQDNMFMVNRFSIKDFTVYQKSASLRPPK